MTNCPVCNSKVDEKAKFCPACGIPLTAATTEWIVSMQERIKATRHNDNVFTTVAVVGILVTVAVPFLMRFVLGWTMDIWSCRLPPLAFCSFSAVPTASGMTIIM